MKRAPVSATTCSVILCGLLAAAFCSGCASARLPPPAAREEVRQTPVLRARIRVSVRGPDGRGHATVLVGFARPDSLRLEIPGPAGARIVVVAREGRLTAVFPPQRAVYLGRASAADLEAVLGVGLAPDEIMDLLVGAPSPRIASPRVRWGERFPKRVAGRLPDGTSLDIRVREVEALQALPPAAFAEPAHPGYRLVDADEARDLWTR
jgi:hypothetical protein